MQLSVPEVADISSEPAHILKMYGADQAGNPVKDLKAGLRAQLHPRAPPRGERASASCSSSMARIRPAAKA